MKNKKAIIKLASILGMGALTGPVAIAAASGLFQMENAPSIAITFMAGPGALITSSLLEGNVKERMLVAAVAGILATIAVIVAAGMGPLILEKMNLKVIQIAGAIAVGIIALMIAGLDIPNKIPLVIILAGIMGGIILR